MVAYYLNVLGTVAENLSERPRLGKIVLARLNFGKDDPITSVGGPREGRGYADRLSPPAADHALNTSLARSASTSVHSGS